MSSLLLLPLPTRVGISSVLGYCSIGFWLCAQIPQVMTNIRLRSCEGLALPFLVNWLFGGLSFGCLGCDASCAYCGVLCILLLRLLPLRSEPYPSSRSSSSRSPCFCSPSCWHFLCSLAFRVGRLLSRSLQCSFCSLLIVSARCMADLLQET